MDFMSVLTSGPKVCSRVSACSASYRRVPGTPCLHIWSRRQRVAQACGPTTGGKPLTLKRHDI